MTPPKLPDFPQHIPDADVQRLMKKCQTGFGGSYTNLHKQAHEVAAGCYGTLGNLMLERRAALARMEALEDYAEHTDECPVRTYHMTKNRVCVCGLSELLAACERERT